MGNTGFKITKRFIPMTSINPLDHIVWSKYPEMKIIKRGQGTITVPANTATATVNLNHGLGYVPAAYSWFDYENNGTFFIARSDMGTLSNYSAKDSEMDIDRTKIALMAERAAYTGTEAFTMKYAYILFSETAEMSYSGNGRPIGYQPSDYGLVVLKEGKNADSKKIYDQIINSNIETLKYHQTYTGQLNYDTTANGEDSAVVSHGLGYIPMFAVYGKFSHQTYFMHFPIGKVPDPFASAGMATKQNIIVEIIWAGSGSPSQGTFDYRVVVFKNRMFV